MLDDGAPITDEQTIRLSLWKDGLIDVGDINAGVIDTNAKNYANYQKEITDTPDSEGMLTIHPDSLDDFPVVNPKKQFLMIEFKDSGDPVSSYQLYTDDYIDKAVLDRFPLIENGSEIYRVLYGNDATTAKDFTIDSHNEGAGNNIDIIANQGTDPDGILRYKAGSDEWRMSNDGGLNFEVIANIKGTPKETYTLDTDDTGGDIKLKFGTALSETLKWDSANTRFNFSDDLRIEGNLATVGQSYIAADHAAADSDGFINLGRNASAWESFSWDDTNDFFNLSDDLNVSGKIISNSYAVHLAEVFDAYDNTGGASITTTESVLNIDTERINDGAYTLSADTVTFNQDGLYRITARFTAEGLDISGTARAQTTLRVEEDTGSGFTDVQGALCSDYARENNTADTSVSCSITYVGSYNNTDDIRLTVQSSTSTTMQTALNGSALTIELIRTE